ncbi:AMP-binding protein [Kribbella sp. NPDC056861]|uniref:AMP-binding protein n=1 Tax=Kribbella sp. NPDC056861 TaxID=3154857 RepID=UPI00344A2537
MTNDDRSVPYPDELAASYLASGLWERHTIAEQFSRVAGRFPHRPAVDTPQGSISYAELELRSDQLAAGLLATGVPAGGAVILQAGNSIATVVTWYGLLKAGLRPVCTLLQHRHEVIQSIAARTGAIGHVIPGRHDEFDYVEFAAQVQAAVPTLVYTWMLEQPTDGEGVCLAGLGPPLGAREARAAVADVQARLGPTDIAVFQLSGGTTGLPKIIPRLQAEYWYNSAAYAERLGWSELERAAHLLPLVHNAGIVCGLHAVHSVGGCLVLAEVNPVDDPERTTELVVELRVTSTVIGPPAFGWVTRDEFLKVAGTLRQVVLSGGKVPRPVFDRLTDLGIWAGQLFGMGEGLCTVTPVDAPAERRARTVGTALSPLDEIRVLVPDTEDEVEPGVAGELCCRGPYTLRGYFDAPDHNQRAFTSSGFYRTGDLARLDVDADGNWLSIEGRIQDGSRHDSALELESLLGSHSAIEQAAVVGTRAYLVAVHAQLSFGAVCEHLDRLGVADDRWPAQVIWIGRLPLTAVGKIDRQALHDRS